MGPGFVLTSAGLSLGRLPALLSIYLVTIFCLELTLLLALEASLELVLELALTFPF